MSSQRKKRKDMQHSNSKPINYTCGVCKQVHKYNDNYPYLCINPLFITADQLAKRTKEEEASGGT